MSQTAPVSPKLAAVPETLLLPLWGRAQLTREGSPILSDPRAVELVDRIDYDFARLAQGFQTSRNVCWAARARQFDDCTRAFLRSHPGATVVNLGAGLDTTFERIDDGRVRWFDLDLPEVVAIRRQLLPETARSRCLAASLLEFAWMDELGDVSAGLLLLAGGVLFYFDDPQVRALFARIGERLPGCELVFDAMSPSALRRANRMMAGVGMAGAQIRWGLRSGADLMRWVHGPQRVEQYSVFRGVPRRGLPWQTRVMMATNGVVGSLTVVRCFW